MYAYSDSLPLNSLKCSMNSNIQWKRRSWKLKFGWHETLLMATHHCEHGVASERGRNIYVLHKATLWWSLKWTFLPQSAWGFASQPWLHKYAPLATQRLLQGECSSCKLWSCTENWAKVGDGCSFEGGHFFQDYSTGCMEIYVPKSVNTVWPWYTHNS